jgi:uncharacterized membrane protein
VFLLLSAIGITTYSSVRAGRASDVKEFGIFLKMGDTGGMLAGLSGVLIGIFGVLTAWEIGYRLTATWLILAYIVVATAVIVPVFTFKRWGERAAELMPEAEAKGEVLAEQRDLASGPRVRAAEAFLIGLVVFVLYVMIYKPGL